MNTLNKFSCRGVLCIVSASLTIFWVTNTNLLTLCNVMLFNDCLVTFTCWQCNIKEVWATLWEIWQCGISTNEASDQHLHVGSLLALFKNWLPHHGFLPSITLKLMGTVKALSRLCVCAVFSTNSIYKVWRDWQNIFSTKVSIMRLGFVYQNGCHLKPDMIMASKTVPTIPVI